MLNIVKASNFHRICKRIVMKYISLIIIISFINLCFFYDLERRGK